MVVVLGSFPNYIFVWLSHYGNCYLDKNGVEMIMKNKNEVVDYLFELYWNRYLDLEDMVFGNNCEGMTDEEADSSLEEMSFIFNKVSPFVRDNLGHNEDEY